MRPRNGWQALLIGAWLLGSVPGAALADSVPAFVEAPCDIPIADDAVRERLRCGTVSVPRDDADPAAGTFELAVVVKRSAAPRPGALPVLILHGGPGGEQTRFMGTGSGDFVAGHDSIAFDMRGGGRTGPALCSGMARALVDGHRDGLMGRDAEATRLPALAACKAEMAAAGFQPTHFGTARNVEDAEAIRRAIGVERWAVYGMSYGTTVAAEYLARRPEAIDSVVLDSLYPPDTFVPSVREAQGRAIGRLLDECAADAACAARFPDLRRATVDAALAALDRDPLPFHLDGQRYQADEVAVRTALHGLFYREATARAVPFFVDAIVRRDGEALAATLGLPLLAGDALAAGGPSMAGLIGTDCRDRPRHHAPPGDDGPSWMAMFIGIQDGACEGLPLGTPPGLPTDTSVPVLVLSAGYDGFQPDGAAVAAAIGPAATPLTIPLAAHVVRGAGECPRGLIAAFIDAPSRPLDSGCLAGMTAPPFLLEARPMPAVVALGASMAGGSPPVAALIALAGATLAVLAGIVLPLGGALWRRWRHAAPGASAAGLRALAVSGGLIAVAGAVLPVAGTLSGHEGAAAFGLEPTLALALWAVPLGGVLAVLGLGRALAKRQWLIAIAALGSAVACAALLAIGLTPWG